MLCLPFEESFHLRSYLSLTFSFLFFFLHLHILFSNVFSRAVEKFNKKALRRKVAHVQFSLYQMLNPPKYTVNSTLQGVASLSFLIASLLDQMLRRLSTPSSKTKKRFAKVEDQSKWQRVVHLDSAPSKFHQKRFWCSGQQLFWVHYTTEP